MYVWNHISEDNIKKNPPHFSVTTSIYHAFLIEKTSNHPLTRPYFRPKSLRNSAHMYILWTPRDHNSGVPTFQQKMVFILRTSNIFSDFPSHDPCSRRKNTTLLEANNHYNIHFWLLILLSLLLLIIILLQQIQKILLLWRLLLLLVCIDHKQLFHNISITDVTNLHYASTYCNNNLST
jgi:hypothetical protein